MAALIPSPVSSSVFGWCTYGLGSSPGDPMLLWPAREDRLRIAPDITIGLAEHCDRVQFAKALAVQTVKSVNLLESIWWASFDAFHVTTGRYALVVLPERDHFLAQVMHAQHGLLLRCLLVMLRYKPGLLYLTVNGIYVGILIDRAMFVDAWKMPFTGHLIFDLHRFAWALGVVGQYEIADPCAEPTQTDPPTHYVCAGYWNSPLGRPASYAERMQLERALNAYPDFLCRKFDNKSGLWTCHANEWYDHQTILRRYIGMKADLQIYGKVQHGWQSGCGIDGERGYKPELAQHRFPVFLWSKRNLDAAHAEGFTWAKAIGAPFLYRPSFPDPGPSGRGLLAFPYHSLPEYPLAADWHRVASDLLATAKEHGFDRATVSLYYYDYLNGEACKAIRESGVDVITFGNPSEPYFMDRLDYAIREHAAVTSDRVCTAGFYAEILDRPFFVSGTALRSDPPDPDEGPGADRDWIRREFPGFLTFDGRCHREVAERELGLEFKQSPSDLLRTLYGWLL